MRRWIGCLRSAGAGRLVPLALLCALTACSGGKERTVGPGRAVDPEGSLVRGAESGLEVRWWVVRETRPAKVEFLTPPDPPEPDPEPSVGSGSKPEPEPEPQRTLRAVTPAPTIADVLGPYQGRPVPLTPVQRSIWRANGLRLVNVPVADLPTLREQLPLGGPVHAQWLGQVPGWMPIAAGPIAPGGISVRTEEGRLDLGPGRPRLLGRCWVVPLADASDGGGAGLRLEVATQFAEQISETEALEMGAGLRADPSAEHEGPIFRSMLLETTLTDDSALLIVPEDPAAEWPRPDPEDQPIDPPASDGGPAGVGPDVVDLPTIGQIMLASRDAEGLTTSRAIIVLMPRVPDRYELLPGIAPRGR